MNDLEHEIRDALRRHEGDAPRLDAQDTRRAASRTRHRQIVNVASTGAVTLVLVIGLVAGLGGLMRADRSKTVVDRPSPSVVIATPSPSGPPSSMACGETPTSAATPLPDARVLDWPDTNRNPSGVYAWDGPGPIGNSYHLEGFMHNGYSRSPGEVAIYITGPEGQLPLVPGRIVPHSGQCAIVAEHEGTYRRFTGKVSPTMALDRDDAGEEWMVDIRGTTIVITLAADPLTPEAELAEAYEIIESISVDPQDSELGFRLIFTIPTNTWDSG